MADKQVFQVLCGPFLPVDSDWRLIYYSAGTYHNSVHVLFFCSAVLVDDNSFVIDVFYLFLTCVSVLPTDIHHLLTRSMVWVGQMTQFDVMSVYSTHSHTLILPHIVQRFILVSGSPSRVCGTMTSSPLSLLMFTSH